MADNDRERTTIVETGGGGGFGDPVERPIDEVLADVVAGYVSPQAAREVYLVAVEGSDRDWRVDDTATRALRGNR